MPNTQNGHYLRCFIDTVEDTILAKQDFASLVRFVILVERTEEGRPLKLGNSVEELSMEFFTRHGIASEDTTDDRFNVGQSARCENYLVSHDLDRSLASANGIPCPASISS